MRSPSSGSTGGTFRGGFNNGGVNRGGYNYGGVNRGGFNNGGVYRGGYNGGYNHGYYGGYNRFGYGRSYYSFGFYGYPYGYGYGFGWPYWGYGGWGWPVGYYDSYSYPYDYYGAGYSSGYGYDPYAYNAYGSNPDGYGYAQQQPYMPPQNYSPTPPPSGTSTESYYRGKPDYYLIAMTDHTIQAVLDYHVEGDDLVCTTREHGQKRIPLASIDRRFTEQINRDRRVEIRIP